MSKKRPPGKPFEQVSMFDMGPVVQTVRAVVTEDFPVDLMVQTTVERARTKSDLYEAQRAALAAFKVALEDAPETGVNPLSEATVVSLGNAVHRASEAFRRATASYDRVWQGRELVSLPEKVQTEIYTRSRASRAAKANGAKRNGRRAARR